jgi:hypothetical protein
MLADPPPAALRQSPAPSTQPALRTVVVREWRGRYEICVRLAESEWIWSCDTCVKKTDNVRFSQKDGFGSLHLPEQKLCAHDYNITNALPAYVTWCPARSASEGRGDILRGAATLTSSVESGWSNLPTKNGSVDLLEPAPCLGRDAWYSMSSRDTLCRLCASAG